MLAIGPQQKVTSVPEEEGSPNTSVKVLWTDGGGNPSADVGLQLRKTPKMQFPVVIFPVHKLS